MLTLAALENLTFCQTEFLWIFEMCAYWFFFNLAHICVCSGLHWTLYMIQSLLMPMTESSDVHENCFLCSKICAHCYLIPQFSVHVAVAWISCGSVTHTLRLPRQSDAYKVDATKLSPTQRNSTVSSRRQCEFGINLNVTYWLTNIYTYQRASPYTQ